MNEYGCPCGESTLIQEAEPAACLGCKQCGSRLSLIVKVGFKPRFRPPDVHRIVGTGSTEPGETKQMCETCKTTW